MIHHSLDTKEILWMVEGWINSETMPSWDELEELRDLVALLNNVLLLDEWDREHDGR
jgi:hypothetical protein